ncbi:MAG: ECF-type sigma factor [Planctomycetota bacterium]
MTEDLEPEDRHDETNGEQPEPTSTPPDPADFLAAYGDDHDVAMNRLMEAVHAELCQLAHNVKNNHGGPASLSSAELVNEVYLRLLGGKPHVVDLNHFLAISAKTMGWILVSRDRRRRAAEPVTTAMEDPEPPQPKTDEVDLREALDRLRSHDRQLATIVEYKYYLEMKVDDIAAALDCAPATVNRRWKLARNWLNRELGGTK